MAKRLSRWRNIFLLFSILQKNFRLGTSFCWTSLCLQRLFCNPTNGRRSLDWRTIYPCTQWPFPFIAQPANNTEHRDVFWVGRMCYSTYFKVVDVAAFSLTKFIHFYPIFVGLSFDINTKTIRPRNGYITSPIVSCSSIVYTSWNFVMCQ
jgi:hypothetical protein